MAIGTASKKIQGKGAARAPSATPARQRKSTKHPGALSASSRSDQAHRGAPRSGEPIDLRLENVEEDPEQPRRTFGEEAMQELVQSITAHGVKVPISVHRHSEVEGRYVINDGARRYRASIRAGKTTVLAVVTDAFSLVEQIVVNKVRDDTPPRDKAVAFARLMTRNGWTQRELAQASGLSEAYVSQHMVLLNLPAPVASIFDSGRCVDVTVVSELVKAYKKDADEVTTWISNDEQEITRGAVKLLRAFLNDKRAWRDEAGDNGGMEDESGFVFNKAETGVRTEGHDSDEFNEKPHLSNKIIRPLILGSYEGRAARLIPDRRWSAEGRAWVRYEDTGEEAEIKLERLQLKRLVEG